MANNRYVMDNDPAVKSYQVEDDSSINQAGFSNQTEREKQLKAEIKRWSPKSNFVCIILCLVHCHYFYVGRIGRGILALCTCNFLFIGMIIDILVIAAGKFKDKNGRYVNIANRMAAEKDLELFYRELAEDRQ